MTVSEFHHLRSEGTGVLFSREHTLKREKLSAA